MGLPGTLQSGNHLHRRDVERIAGGFLGCYTMDVDVQGVHLKLMIDTGSSDTTVAVSGLNQYSGPTVPLERPAGAKSLSAKYSDKSGWTGFGTIAQIGLPGTNIYANNAPVVGMAKQTTNPPFSTGKDNNGLLGLSYSSRAIYISDPPSVMDAWLEAGVIEKNEILVHGCPYDLAHQSYIDIGNTSPSHSCGSSGTPLAWAKSPRLGEYTVDIKSVYVGSQEVSLPKNFQKGDDDWSYVDTCTPLLNVPKPVASALFEAIIQSGGLPAGLTTHEINEFTSGEKALPKAKRIDWSLLPSLTFEIAATGGRGKTFKIMLGPHQYIQPDLNGDNVMIVISSFSEYIVLGVAFHSSLDILHDRKNGKVGFSLGCGCESSPDGYPKIEDASFFHLFHVILYLFNKSHLAPLQTTINKGIRLFTGARLSTAIGPLLVETGIGLTSHSLIGITVGKIPALVLVSSDQTAIQEQILADTTSQTKDSQATTLVCIDGDSANMWETLHRSKTRKAIQIGILVDTHPFSVDRCILCDQQLLSTSIAHLVVECEQVTGHRIQSGLVPAIQKSRLRLLGRALDPGVENVYTWLRGGVLNGEADLDQRWLDGTVEHESMGTRHDNRALAARLADFLQVAYRQYQSTLWKYHRDRLVEVG
ncbi:hypothetical protein BASA62_008159 [Batrachochytrium salamandrivorans]|nr:hypothetical protein BASA62_008159 [Batrachochytrium salamandrivorans]